MSHLPRSTSPLLSKLRAAMKATSPAIQAYIVPSEDAHNSEYIAECDERRAFISNFTGSSGVAVVTADKAALWTDGRYFLQAAKQLDQNWILMKMGLPETPSQAKWLAKELKKNEIVGVDPKLISQSSWEALVGELKNTNLTLFPVSPNLIDSIWDHQPLRPSLPISIQPLHYSGCSWQDKVSKLRGVMRREKAGLYVASALDDVAWLLNLRGQDVPFNPVFFAYAFLSHDALYLCTEQARVADEVRKHLGATGDEPQVLLRAYEEAENTLLGLVQHTAEHECDKVWLSPSSNTTLFKLVPEERQLKKYSEVAVMKCVKNSVELEGFRNCHVRDGAAMCDFLHWLEGMVARGEVVTEVQAADHSKKCRRKQDLFVSLSFDTISSTGPNAAINHYKATTESDTIILPNNIYLVDSGAQYRDGTTDVTRTVHFTEPSRFEKEAFTWVLKGHISLQTAVFPNGTKGLFLDCLARQHLWKAGLDFRHGTSHGVGSFLNVHEGPIGIAQRIKPEDVALKQGMVLSNEPGYYEDGVFGIRIENLIEVVAMETKHNFKDTGFLTFKALTLVPLQRKLICKQLLTQEEINWVDGYHSEVREQVGGLLRAKGEKEVADWLDKQTEKL